MASHGVDIVDVPDTPAVKLGTKGRAIEVVAAEACAAREAFDVIFIHADTGGRSLEQGLPGRSLAYCEAITRHCEWPADRCVTITPRHETEAWLLADGQAVASALGYNGKPETIELPESARQAERLDDPKQVLERVAKKVAGRRRSQSIELLFPAIAQRQSIQILRSSESFASFEQRLRKCLASLGHLK